jgi:hypothetical protein
MVAGAADQRPCVRTASSETDSWIARCEWRVRALYFYIESTERGRDPTPHPQPSDELIRCSGATAGA